MELINTIVGLLGGNPIGWAISGIAFVVGLPIITLLVNTITTWLSDIFLFLDNQIVDKLPFPLKGWFQDQLNKNLDASIKRLTKLKEQIKD